MKQNVVVIIKLKYVKVILADNSITTTKIIRHTIVNKSSETEFELGLPTS